MLGGHLDLRGPRPRRAGLRRPDLSPCGEERGSDCGFPNGGSLRTTVTSRDEPVICLSLAQSDNRQAAWERHRKHRNGRNLGHKRCFHPNLRLDAENWREREACGEQGGGQASGPREACGVGDASAAGRTLPWRGDRALETGVCVPQN